MKTKTITVKACEVKTGDAIEGHTVTRATIVGGFAEIDACQVDVIMVPKNWQIVVSRPLPDACPRGRMTYGIAVKYVNIEIGGVNLCDMPTVQSQHFLELVKDWWNNRTTAEIEAGLEQGK